MSLDVRHPSDLLLAHARAALARQAIERQRSSSPETIQTLGLGILEVAGAAALYATTVPWEGANTIVNLGIDHPVTQLDLQVLLTPFQKHRLPFTVTLSPLAQPAALYEWLQEAELVEQNPHWLLAQRLPAHAPRVSGRDLSTEQLTEDQQADFARIMLDETAPEEQLAYMSRPSSSNMFRYGVFLDAQMVAAAQMTTSGRLAHFSGASTLPAFRGRGAQSALLQRRLEDAVNAGCDQASVDVSVTNGASLRNVERAGFARRYQERHFLWTPA